MSDLISRQAAIDALARAAREKFNLSDEFNHYLAGLMDGETAIRQLPSAQQEQRWIPVSERMPECGKDVLVTREYDGREDFNESCKYAEVANCCVYDDDVEWFSYSDEYKANPKNHKVVAWMPLPEPYKEERG